MLDYQLAVTIFPGELDSLDPDAFNRELTEWIIHVARLDAFCAGGNRARLRLVQMSAAIPRAEHFAKNQEAGARVRRPRSLLDSTQDGGVAVGGVRPRKPSQWKSARTTNAIDRSSANGGCATK